MDSKQKSAFRTQAARQALKRALSHSEDLDAFSLTNAAQAAREAAEMFENAADLAMEQEELEAEFD